MSVVFIVAYPTRGLVILGFKPNAVCAILTNTLGLICFVAVNFPAAVCVTYPKMPSMKFQTLPTCKFSYNSKTIVFNDNGTVPPLGGALYCDLLSGVASVLFCSKR